MSQRTSLRKGTQFQSSESENKPILSLLRKLYVGTCSPRRSVFRLWHDSSQGNYFTRKGVLSYSHYHPCFQLRLQNCSRHIPHDCCPDPKLVQKVFGVDLVSIVNLHGTVRPLVVGLVVSELERRGAYRTEGLYRENGDGSVIDKLKAQIDHSKYIAKR